MKHWDYIAIGLILWAVWWYVDANQGSGTSAGAGLGSSFVDLWAHAIAGFENVNPAYNDPGGLNMVGDAGSTPAQTAGGPGVIGIFSSLQAGYAALEKTLNKFIAEYGDKSLLDATAIYVMGPNGAAAAAGNYPQGIYNYANTVADQLNVPVTATLNQLDGPSE